VYAEHRGRTNAGNDLQGCASCTLSSAHRISLHHPEPSLHCNRLYSSVRWPLPQEGPLSWTLYILATDVRSPDYFFPPSFLSSDPPPFWPHLHHRGDCLGPCLEVLLPCIIQPPRYQVWLQYRDHYQFCQPLYTDQPTFAQGQAKHACQFPQAGYHHLYLSVNTKAASQHDVFASDPFPAFPLFRQFVLRKHLCLHSYIFLIAPKQHASCYSRILVILASSCQISFRSLAKPYFQYFFRGQPRIPANARILVSSAFVPPLRQFPFLQQVRCFETPVVLVSSFFDRFHASRNRDRCCLLRSRCCQKSCSNSLLSVLRAKFCCSSGLSLSSSKFFRHHGHSHRS
jgi:hypothetical protein